jgi:hypothetical protein
MLRRVLAFNVVASVVFAPGCSTQEPLLQQGARCGDTLQCATPLTCACLVIGQPDPEGNEEPIQYGMCEPKTFDTAKCPQDAGTDAHFGDTALPDTGVETAADAEADAATDADEGG